MVNTRSQSDSTDMFRIMIVDDSKLMRKSVTRILKGLNDVVEAENGAEAWEKLASDTEIRLVCCDLSMPVMDGFGFLAKVRASDDPRIQQMPIIIVTGQEDTEENRNRIFEAGATGFVSKPFDSAELRSSIKLHSKLEKTSSELKKKEDEIEAVAAHDALTGLGTRAFFEKAASQVLSYSKRNHHDLVVLRLQIDYFRQTFLKIGREKSNLLVKKVGEILSRHTRNEDTVCRMGLDEFAALLSTRDTAGAIRMAERVREMVDAIQLRHEDETIDITVSIGIVKVHVHEGTEVSDLLGAAREYLDVASNNGGNQVAYDNDAVSNVQTPILNVEQALYLLRRGEEGQVLGQLEQLLNRIRPLLELREKTKK